MFVFPGRQKNAETQSLEHERHDNHLHRLTQRRQHHYRDVM